MRTGCRVSPSQPQSGARLTLLADAEGVRKAFAADRLDERAPRGEFRGKEVREVRNDIPILVIGARQEIVKWFDAEVYWPSSISTTPLEPRVNAS